MEGARVAGCTYVANSRASTPPPGERAKRVEYFSPSYHPLEVSANRAANLPFNYFCITEDLLFSLSSELPILKVLNFFVLLLYCRASIFKVFVVVVFIFATRV